MAPSRRARRRFSLLALAAIAATVAVVVSGGLGPGALQPIFPPNPKPVVTGSPVTERFSIGGSLGYPSPSFWGANVRVFSPIGSVDAARFNQTTDTWVRWPGGATGDALNYTSNQIRNTGGSTYTPPQSVSAFVAWCGWVQCRAILELPAEINDSHTAAFYVAYVERTLGFHPAYWEVGNERAVWTHFGIPWTNWSASDHTNATPFQYAYLVKLYVAAIRSVDPGAKIIGFPGLGQGSTGERAWIQNVVAYNGATIDAVAVHTYPAGTGSSSSTPATFFGSLSGAGSLSAKIPGDRAQVLKACPSCTALQVLSDETSSATSGANYSTELAGEAQAAYMMAETIQGLRLNLSNLDYFAYESTYPGSWFSNSSPSSERPVFPLYSVFFPNSSFGQTLGTSLSPSAGTLFTVVERNGSQSGHTETLLAANANTGTTFVVSLKGSGFPVSRAATVYEWDPSSSQPKVTAYPAGSLPVSFTLAPEGLLEVVVS